MLKRQLLVKSRRTFIGTVVVPMVVAGCATIGQGPPRVTSVRIATTRQEHPRKEGTTATAVLTGSRLVVHAMQVCDIREEYTNGETRISERVNKTPVLDYALLGAGIAFTGAGIATVADANHVYSSDKTSRNYNPVGPNNAQAIGYGLTAVGVALMVVPVVDALRAQGETRELVKVDEPGDVVESGAPCKHSPRASAAVSIVRDRQTSGQYSDSLSIGTTDAAGFLKVDLEPIIPPSVPWADSKYTVVIGSEKAAQLDLRPLVSIREGRAWSALDPSKCANPATSTACEPVVEFLKQYEFGPHTAEAQSLLDEQAIALRKLRDDELWVSSKTSREACVSAKDASPLEIDSYCESLKIYLGEFQDGQHATEAKQALEKARKRREALVAEILREEKAVQAKKAADARKKCVAECRVGCSGWRFSDHAACFSGCVESQCTGGEQ